MELIGQVTQYFLLSLAFGVGIFSLLANTNLTGVGFYKLILGIIIGCLSICLVVAFIVHQDDDRIVIFYILSFVISCLLFFTHQNHRSLIAWCFYVLKMISVLGASFFLLEMRWEILFYYLSTTCYMGGVTYMMILGHWYLLTPKLTEQPLLLGLRLVWLILFLKVLMALWGYTDHREFLLPEAVSRVSYSFNWVIFIMRVVWGYLIVGVLSYFCWRLVKIRSLQSATGVLYVMTFFIFIGEIMSIFLFYQYGVKI